MSTETETNWSEQEFAEIKLGDERLKKRAIKLAQQLGAQPQAFINQACEDWADTKAAYRFFDNEKIRPDEIIVAHRKRVEQRMRNHPLVLAIQDTTELDYTAHPNTQGLGPIGNDRETVQGLLMHTTLAVTEKGLPLGVLTLHLWTRDKKSRREEYEHKTVAIEDKESAKWIKALEQTLETLPSGVQVVTICDREADIYEFLLIAEKKEAAYVVRAGQDRRLMAEERCLWEKLGRCRVAGELEVEVAAKKGEPARTATVEVRFKQVKLRPPQRLKRIRKEVWKPILLWAIYVKEKGTPEAVTPLEWMLLTNVAAGNFDEAVERVEWYCQRWQIEVYIKVLKSGCRIESCLLATAGRLKRYVALMSVVAWRLFWMTQIKRQNPKASCTMVLTEHEWQSLYCRINKTRVLPQQPPTVSEAVRWIARLGGFLGRKGDQEPGVTVIWRGWQRLNDIAATWLLLHPD
jgi:hypothetical protein